MDKDTEKILARYDYNVPADLIAREPARPRDAARLLVYDRLTRKIGEDTFRNIVKYLPPKSVLVFNETKVIPARLELQKTTGGKVRVLFVGVEHGWIKILSPKSLRISEKLSVKNRHFVVVNKESQFWFLRPSFPVKDIYKILEKYGEMPIPPYIKNSPLSKSELKKEYQTVFARWPGSVAAPTAALHFTESLMSKIKKAGHEIVFVTLHVNLGTFAPLTEGNFKTGKLHLEYYEIHPSAADKLNIAKSHGRKIIAVGTTSLRALESAEEGGQLRKLKGETDVFIHGNSIPLIRPNEGYDRKLVDYGRFGFVDGLITNFHVPRSSLMMLVAALVGREKTLQIYKTAIQKRFRFFSFGDGMLIV